jgi:hypothetical protein
LTRRNAIKRFDGPDRTNRCFPVRERRRAGAHDTTGHVPLRLDVDGFERVQRPAMYEIASAMRDLASDVQRTLGLRPGSCRISMRMAVSAVQRYARAPDAAHMAADPLPTGATGKISSRPLA